MAKRAKSIGHTARQNDLLQKTCTYLDQFSKIPTIAKAWGEKLLQLDPLQREFAEKAIGDVLFEASQGTLNRNSVKINEELSYRTTIVSPDTVAPANGPSPQPGQVDTLVDFFSNYK